MHFIGVLFTPLMRPLFNTPGEGAFVMSMGLAAGYPMDAVITAQMSRIKDAGAEVVVTFSNAGEAANF